MTITTKARRRTAALLLGLILLGGGCLSAPCPSVRAGESFSYRLYELGTPRPNRVHVLRVDLAGGDLVPAVVLSKNPPEAEFNATLTDPLELAAHPDTVALVNTNPWSPWPIPFGDRRVRITGLAAAGGEVRSRPTSTSIWFEDGRAFIGDPGTTEISEGTGTWGRRLIVAGGEITTSTPEEGSGQLAPRTAIGCCREGTTLWLVVVDGRRPGFSEGMNNHELALFMRSLGAWQAANMDGGGSSILIVDQGRGPRVVNRPSGGHRRPLPLALTIRRKKP